MRKGVKGFSVSGSNPHSIVRMLELITEYMLPNSMFPHDSMTYHFATFNIISVLMMRERIDDEVMIER